jgi:DNA-binding NarL/FixJ family response regulator
MPRPRSNSNSRLRVALVNDYEVIVAGVRAMLMPYRDSIQVIELDVHQDPEHDVDVALFDTYGQPGLGLERIQSLVKSERVGAVAVYTWSASATVRDATQRAGASGLIAKALPASELVDAMQGIAAGRSVDTGRFRGSTQGPWPGSQWGLTSRESETLVLLSAGMANRTIAEALFVSENTVRTHLKAVFRKLEVKNRSQAVARALTDPGFMVKSRTGSSLNR